MPAGTTLRGYREEEATVTVWCPALFGITSKSVTNEVPPETSWLTMTLRWTDSGWKLPEVAQRDEPQPIDDNAEFGQGPQFAYRWPNGAAVVVWDDRLSDPAGKVPPPTHGADGSAGFR
ncbi:hypothetical protein OHA71_49265 [Streptomyces sp. NBC_00444]|uniref:hypothetical protein n=1 Tax=Streptomyces sp. NBC_00444 TaxID=2975744 RepID=UPI002E1B989F